MIANLRPDTWNNGGVNLAPHFPASTEVEALDHAPCAVKVGSDLWMSFDANDPGWAAAHFAEHDLRVGEPLSTQ